MDTLILKKEMIKENHTEDYIELCVSYAQVLKDNGYPIIFDVKHFALLIGVNPKEIYSYYLFPEELYKTIKIPKKKGGLREITAPSENLKYIQRWILYNILYRASVDNNVNGFIKNKSIVDNAKEHVGKECVMNLDIKDFFPSITYIQIYNLFIKFGYTRHLSMVFTGLCTYKNILPQGAPTSPFISNLICKRLDSRLDHLAKKVDATYSRYADDITFSGNKNITKYLSLIKRVITDEKFKVNEKKVRVQFKYHQQMVTGIVVNEKLSVPTKTKKYIRQQIYFSKKFGVKDNLRKQNINKTNYREHLYGLAYFIKMVESDYGNELLRDLSEIDWES